MIKVAVVLGALLIAVAHSATFDSTTRVAQTLNKAFRTLSGNVVGDERVLFGPQKNFRPGECCNDAKAFDDHPDQIDLVIALDESGSVGLSNFNIMKTFIKRIVSHFVVSHSATRVALVTWSSSVTLEFDFDEYINNDGVNYGIDSAVYSGGLTATGDALHLIRNSLFSQSSSSATKVLFIITDGRSNRQTHDPTIEAQHLKNSGVEIFAFGIGNNINTGELTSLASAPTVDHRFNVETFSDVSALSHLIQNTVCTNGNVVYDACARRCTCSNGKLTNCKRIRKHFPDMTDLERCRYIRAVRRASTVQPFKSEYDQLIAIHEQLFSIGIHGGPTTDFVPWHRWYILAYENILRKVDCRVTVPYWDWSLDSDSPFTSDVWNTDLCKYTGLGGNGNPSCVTTGPFASPGWRVTPSAANSCLRRSHSAGVPDCTAVQDVLDTTTAQFNDFHIGLEVMLHNIVHVRIGGTMVTRESSNAPEFFLHHGFIDKLWGDWQEKGHAYKIHHYYNDVSSMPGTSYSPRDVHDLDNQPYFVKVYYQEPDTPCTIAGRKFTMKQISTLSVSARRLLDPTPVPIIPRAALTLFRVPQSVINSLPAVTRRLFGASVPIETLTVQKLPKGPIGLPGPPGPTLGPRGPPGFPGPVPIPRFQRRANKKNQE